jgi:hypothetical protein
MKWMDMAAEILVRVISVNWILSQAKEILYPPRNTTERFLVASH